MTRKRTSSRRSGPGASGYLLKDIPYDEVADVVRAVHGGQSLINPSMAAKLLTEFAALAKRDGEERTEQVPAPQAHRP